MAGRHRSTSAAWLRSLSSRPPVVLAVVALAVVAVLGGAVAIARWNTGASNATGQPPQAGQPTKPSMSLRSNTAASTSHSPSRRAELAACQSYFQHQLSAAQAAAVSLNQWREHIQAMNQLVAGLITLDQATQYWNQTRRGAMHKVADFQHLQQQLSGSGCAQPTTGRHRLARCVKATKAYHRVLDAARTTISTWKMHIDDMESLRSGQLSPQRATKLWIHNWHVGAHQLSRYDHIAARAQGRTCV